MILWLFSKLWRQSANIRNQTWCGHFCWWCDREERTITFGWKLAALTGDLLLRCWSVPALRHSPLSNENNCTKLLAHWKHWQVFYSRDRDLTITVVRLSVCSSFHPSVSICIIIAIITKQVLSSVLFYILHWFACRSDQLRLIKRQH